MIVIYTTDNDQKKSTSRRGEHSRPVGRRARPLPRIGAFRVWRMTTWLTAEDAAAYVKVSLRMIRQAVQQGELPAYPVGRSGRFYRLTAADVDKWIMSRSYEPR